MKNLFKQQFAFILSAILLVASIVTPPPSNGALVPPDVSVVCQDPGGSLPLPPLPVPAPIEWE